MPNRSIDIVEGGFTANGNTVSEDHFGAIQTGHVRSSLFEDQAEQLGVGHIRWPGGTLSELEPEIYGLDIPNLFDATQMFNPNPDRERPGLSDMLEKAVDGEHSFSMIVPTSRYEGKVSEGVEELRSFMQDLLAGEYGNLPSDFTLEIGNEYIGKFSGGASSYGEVADQFVQTISSSINDPEINPGGASIKIAVQMGYNHEDDQSIRAQISEDSFSNIDTLVAHSLPIRFEGVDRQERGDVHSADLGESGWENDVDNLDLWRAQISESGGTLDPEFYVSAWNVGAGRFDPNEVNLEFQDYGLRGASASIEVVSTYVDAGADMMDVWGVGANNLNSISSAEGGETRLSPAGEAFRSMSEVLPGTQIHDGFQLNSRDDEVMQYVFENDEYFVVFLAANDIPEDGIDVDLNFALDLDIGYVHAESIGATLADDFSGTFDELEARVHEVADVTRTSFRGDLDSFTVHLEQDYEVVRVVLSKGEPTPDLLSKLIQPHADPEASLLEVETNVASESVTFVGLSKAESIVAGEGNDTLYGKGGADNISSSGGDDVVIAGAGNDTVESGGGNDLVKGGWGADNLLGGSGNDNINGNQGNDLIFGEAGSDTLSGAKGDDVILGGLGDDWISGGWGKDILDGERGNDEIRGYPGQDTLYGGSGNDFLHGGSGNDVAFGGRDDDRVFGGAGNDTLYGDGGDDFVGGGMGNDRLQGNSGDDYLNGYIGTDHLDGGTGNDTLNGGAGNDTIVGGSGNDTLIGGLGADTFVASAVNGYDRINDFQMDTSSTHDRIDLSDVAAIESYEDLLSNHVRATQNGLEIFWEDDEYDEHEDSGDEDETDSGLYLAEAIAEALDPLHFLF